MDGLILFSVKQAMKGIYQGLLVCVLTLFFVLKANAQIIGFGSSKPGSVNYTAASVLSQLLSEHTDLIARTIPHSGTASTIYVLNKGEVHFAVSNLVEAVWASQGQDFFSSQGEQKDLRLVGTIFQLITGFMVREDSEIYTLSDLKGARVPARYNGQPIFETLQQALLANGNLSYSDVSLMPVSTGIHAADQFTANRLDTFFFGLGASKVREVDATVGGLRALPIDVSAEAMTRLRKYMPVAYATQARPEDNIPGVYQTINVMTYDNAILASTHTADDIVYHLTRTVYENGDQLRKMSPLLATFDEKTMARQWENINYHPGAIRFYKEIGLWPAEE